MSNTHKTKVFLKSWFITFGASYSPSYRVRALAAALAFLFCLTAAAGSVNAVQPLNRLYVTITGDPIPPATPPSCLSPSDNCSLREAVNAANADTTQDLIQFQIPAGDAGCTGGVCTITLTLGELAINDAATAGTLTITNSTGASNLLISGNNASRVFYLNPGANLTINGITITKGNGTGTTNPSFNNNGGGIFNYKGGTLNLTDSTVRDNTAASNGGGIDNEGFTLNLTNSTVSGNMATVYGGGIYNGFSLSYISGTLNLTNSTISGNTGTYTGGIDNDGGTLNLTSVTVTRNSSTDTGCTNCVGGVYGGSSDTLKNTIVAGNTAANANSSPDFSGAVATGSAYNLIGNGQGMTGISNNDANHNQVGVDPKLGPHADNGGATQTQALLGGSPAIDQGNSFGLTTDQRGMSRPVIIYPSNPPPGDGSDIGAYEAQLAPTAAMVSVGGRVMMAKKRGIRNVVITMTDSNGNQRRATSSLSGYYHFADVAAGEIYILTATSKRFTFSEPTKVLNINEDTENVNFIANDVKNQIILNVR